jgi:hypothetical protein
MVEKPYKLNEYHLPLHRVSLWGAKNRMQSRGGWHKESSLGIEYSCLWKLDTSDVHTISVQIYVMLLDGL